MTPSSAALKRQGQPDVQVAALAFSVFLTSLGLSLSWNYWFSSPVIPSPAWVVVIISAGLAVAYLTKFEIAFRGERMELTFAEVPAAFALLYLSPWLMGAIWVAGAVLNTARHRSAWYKLVFNAATQLCRVGLGVLVLRSFVTVPIGVTDLFFIGLSVAVAEAASMSLLTVFVRWVSGRGMSDSLPDVVIASGQSVVGAALGTLGVMAALQHPVLLVLPAVVVALIGQFSRQHIADRQSYQDLLEVHGFLETVSGRNPTRVTKDGLDELRQILQCRWVLMFASTGGLLERSGDVPDDVLKAIQTADLTRGFVEANEMLHVSLANGKSVLASRPAAGFERRAQRLFKTAVDLLANASDRAALQIKLDYDATHDQMTGLLARSGFLRAADNHLRSHDGAGTVVVIDLARFTEVNNTLGFKAGDLLLRETASRLVSAVGENQVLARLERNSFGLFLKTTDRAEALTAATRIREALHGTIDLEGLELSMMVRIGISIGPGHGSSTEQLLRAADVAAELARETQPAVVVYRAEADVHSETKLELLHRMKRALEAESFEVWFQPKTDTISGLVVGAEALLRWQDHDRWIPPDEFIPAAEAAGMMNELTDFVLRRSLAAAAQWADAGHQIGVAVNLSPSSLEDPELPLRIAAELRRFNVSPPFLTIEITESVLMGQGDTAAGGLNRLRDLGVRLSVDDFGTGYSSLRYLKDLDVDELKLDRSFVQDLSVSDRSETIARAVVGLGHSLGLRVVAEGVETPSARQILQEMGCDVLQGYLIARPMPLDNFDTWINRYVASLRTPKTRRATHAERG